MVTRRNFLLGSIAVTGGVAFGYRHVRKQGESQLAWLQNRGTPLTPYIIIDKVGVTIITPRAEMGQCIHTTLAALVAEELDMSLTEINVEHGPASDLYANDLAYPRPKAGTGIRSLFDIFAKRSESRSAQLTGGQTSTQDAFVKMRKAGAAARQVLIQAAAEVFDDNPADLETRNGYVTNGGGRQISYIELAPRAAGLDMRQDPPLKARNSWTLLGQSQPRVDLPPKCNGSAIFAADVQLPGMLCATAKMNPRTGGRISSINSSSAGRMPGVKKILELETGVLVVATDTWSAFRAAEEIEVKWGPPPFPLSDDEHRQALSRSMLGEFDSRPRDDGDVDQALMTTNVIDGHYWVPYLAHATMEPMNAVARLQDGQLDIWAGTQFPTEAALAGARIAGIAREKVNVHTTYMGGGFGRRLETDFVRLAVIAAVEFQGQPVKVTWSREEDITHDVYRPTALARYRASLEDGQPYALDLKLAAPSIERSRRRREGYEGARRDKFIVLGAWEQPYKIPHFRVSGYDAGQLLPVGWWRSVGESQNSFFLESIIDELAHATASDPLEMRLQMIDHLPSRRALETVAELSGWGSALPTGFARGLAFVVSSGAPTAVVILIRKSSAGIQISKIFAAIDVGIALDPRNIEAQIESSLLFGLDAAIQGKISIRDGAVMQSNFHDYPLLRISQVPEIEIAILESGNQIFGVGESGTPAIAPALGNAIFAATNERVRELPFRDSVRFIW